MGTKNNPGAFDCHSAAEPDEPIFTLRAKDPIAPNLIRNWAMMRFHHIAGGQRPNTPEQWAKVGEALDCANQMDAWRARKYPTPTLTAVIVGGEDEALPGEQPLTKPN